MGSGFKTAAIFAVATALVQTAYAWSPDLPECLSPFRPFVYTGCFGDPDGTTLIFRSGLDQNNMTVELCQAECKGNGYRYAGLEYYGICYCGTTVDGPQVDDSQCTFPCTANSSEICGGNNLLSMYEDPTFEPVNNNNTIADYSYLGCWTDDSDQGRALVYQQNLDTSTLTTEICLQTCKDEGFPFAGTEYGSQCWCGVVIGNGTAAAPSTDCDMTCNGDSGEICGGPARLSLYVATDLESLEPCGYNSSTTTTTTYSTSITSVSSTTSVTTTTSLPPTTTTTSITTTTSLPPTTTTTSITTTTTLPPTTTTSKTTTSTSLPPTTTTSKTTTIATTTPPTTTTSKTISTTTSSSCTSTTTGPSKCEYGCGNWCSSNLPNWSAAADCAIAQAQCKLQINSCFAQAGWPGAFSCYEFANWCESISSYCSSSCKGSATCSKSDYFGKNPPSGGKPGTTSTSVYACKTTMITTTTTTTTSKTTTSCAVPTATGVCTQPSNSQWGYSATSPVGGVALAILTCNNLLADYNVGNVFKLYTDTDSTKCKSYPKGSVSGACHDACTDQYNNCVNVYAQSCKTNKLSDSYSTALIKCSAQQSDCYSQNSAASAWSKCGSFGTGW